PHLGKHILIDVDFHRRFTGCASAADRLEGIDKRRCIRLLAGAKVAVDETPQGWQLLLVLAQIRVCGQHGREPCLAFRPDRSIQRPGLDAIDTHPISQPTNSCRWLTSRCAAAPLRLENTLLRGGKFYELVGRSDRTRDQIAPTIRTPARELALRAIAAKR